MTEHQKRMDELCGQIANLKPAELPSDEHPDLREARTRLREAKAMVDAWLDHLVEAEIEYRRIAAEQVAKEIRSSLQQWQSDPLK